MIRKFLVCGKQLYLQSKRLEAYEEQAPVIELVMPIERFWEIEQVFKEAEYLQASGEPVAEILAVYKRIFHLCASYAVAEKEREWLHGRAKD